jgi:DNA-binding PadR family transcriptional regulator
MSAKATTLTVLGAVVVFEPVNGYQLRRELLSWRVDQWASINPGSVYSMLSTLTRRGFVERHDLEDGGRQVAVYTSTDAGRQELRRLLCEALTRIEPLSPLTFHVALNLESMLPRSDALECLTRRLEAVRATRAEVRDSLDRLRSTPSAPPHVTDVLELQLRMVDVDEAWIGEHVARIRAGAYTFAGEEGTWQPPAEDPGWQMAQDRERYLRLLGATGVEKGT